MHHILYSLLGDRHSLVFLPFKQLSWDGSGKILIVFVEKFPLFCLIFSITVVELITQTKFVVHAQRDSARSIIVNDSEVP